MLVEESKVIEFANIVRIGNYISKLLQLVKRTSILPKKVISGNSYAEILFVSSTHSQSSSVKIWYLVAYFFKILHNPADTLYCIKN